MSRRACDTSVVRNAAYASETFSPAILHFRGSRVITTITTVTVVHVLSDIERYHDKRARAHTRSFQNRSSARILSPFLVVQRAHVTVRTFVLLLNSYFEPGGSR